MKNEKDEKKSKLEKILEDEKKSKLEKILEDERNSESFPAT